MYLAWALPLLFPFLRQIGSEARIPGAEPHYFCIFTQSIEICRPCCPQTMGMTIHKRGINYYLFEFIIKKMIVYKNYSYRIAAKEVLH
ncbi:hypothetical protein ABRC56_004383 [Salmonella enterica]|nr:hypothetical protein [Salmonella enterica]ECS4203957.1 hypothetical protein [Salmonella enterica subsp. enterica serovar Mississippi]EDM7279556.1 hypothetical protein [Salmonella enterica subsp. enterica serovar Enteritidis]EAT8350788.1 hypothetical protein [Salmonella enterica]EAV8478563.1 hypothetical protein [Salmonella enterica]EAY9771036.1 hypothetical protein [Salmonella enterica]